MRFVGEERCDQLPARILRGMILGFFLGLAARVLMACSEQASWVLRIAAVEALDPFGQIFLRTLFYIVAPLVFSSLALGVVQLGHLRKLGPIAARTFALFLLNMTVAVLLGLALMNLIKPGASISEQTKAALVEAYGRLELGGHEALLTNTVPTFRTLLELVMPRNVLKAVVELQMLPLIVFALMIGAAGVQLDEQRRNSFREWLAILVDLSTNVVGFAMILAPYAVATMICSLVIKVGFEIAEALAAFVLIVVGAIGLHLFGTMSLWLKFWTRRSPAQFFKKAQPVLITAFSTSSSSATLPTTIAVSRSELGISGTVAGFVLPLGATMNMSGTALYEGCAVLFIAQAFGVDLSLAQQALLVILTVLSAIAVAGIPGGSIPVIVGLCSNLGLPPEGITLILGVDRILDMARTALNVGADMVTACIVDRYVVPEAEDRFFRETEHQAGMLERGS